MNARSIVPGLRPAAALMLTVWVLAAVPAWAQSPSLSAMPAPVFGQAGSPSVDGFPGLPGLSEAVTRADVFAPGGLESSDRACDGCPWRRPGHALVQTLFIHVAYGLVNLARGHETAKVTPVTWWSNMKAGWEWDLNDFVVNQIGHPYQGSNFFTAGRGNGLSFWESAGVTAFGSATWEYFGETTRPSLNDFINTTLGGIALGEIMHRTAWIVRDTQASGGRRLGQEILAAAIDPLTGLNRFLSGDANRISEKPPGIVPSSLGGEYSLGVLWQGEDAPAREASGQLFLDVDLRYGDMHSGRSLSPYDAFVVRLRLGGGSPVSDVQVRGRLLGRPLWREHVRLTILQGYDYIKNNAYEFGGQSFETTYQASWALSPRVSARALGWGGITVLGAVDSLPLGEPAGEGPESGGDSANQRTYDYGPGWNFGGSVHFIYGTEPFAAVAYEAHHLYVIDGVKANHLLQRARLSLMLPLHGPLGFGVSAEYFDRITLFQDPASTRQQFHYPQFRAHFTWRLS